jgi:nucleosome binding factor SPN SPT16 subunit
MTEEVILNPPKIDIKLKPENVDIAYPPLFQSGGKFDLRLNATTDDQPLHGGEWALGTLGPSGCCGRGWGSGGWGRGLRMCFI